MSLFHHRTSDGPQLTAEQEKIVGCNDKIILASACPGSGKSTTLAARARRLWNDYQEPILVCTFSNKAAQDIGQKIGLGGDSQVQVKTIHRFGYDIVRQNWSKVKEIWGNENWPAEAQLASQETEIELLSSWLKEGEPRKFFAKVEKLREFGFNPSQLISLSKHSVYLGPFGPRDLETWRAYEAFRLSKGLLLFSDMIDIARNLLAYPDISNRFIHGYSHLLLDEAQDTSSDQWDLLRPLIDNCRSCLIVYDINQAIYGWRGGDVGPLNTLGFLNRAVRFSLTESFRSGTEIAVLANKVVHDKRSQIQTKREGALITLKGFADQEAEVDYVLDRAGEHSAIIARTNSYLEKLERRLIQKKLPYQGSSFYRSVHLRKFVEFLEEAKNVNWKKLVEDSFLKSTAYTREEKSDFREAIRIIHDEGIDKFISLWERSRTLDERGITLTTGHSSKGLEWDEVFVVGCHTGQIPHRNSSDEVEEMNLFYVMVTRAKNELYISWVGEPSYFIPPEYLKR